MSISEQEKKNLEILEESLWRDETRFDTAYMEKILHPDFFEFGRSGRIYKRNDTIYVPRQTINAIFPLHNIAFHTIGEDSILVTYQSQVQYDVLEIGNRSSLWVNTNNGWQLRFHQGTKVNQE